MITLAGTGPALWELLAEWRTQDDLIEILAAAYGAEVGAVAADVVPLLADLRAQRIVEMAADSGGSAAE